MTFSLPVYIPLLKFPSRNIYLPALLLMACASASLAQQTGTVYGVVKDPSGLPKANVNVAAVGLPGGAATDDRGAYSLEVPAQTDITIAFSHLGFQMQRVSVRLRAGERRELNRQLSAGEENLPTVVVSDERSREAGIIRIDPRTIEAIPTPSGSFESVLKTLPGVNMPSELSSQYFVRGGNYDENLVYVNDFEIYRPLLVRSGQQEGLSFIHPEMVNAVNFSAGGFAAEYGDKLSSVLDVSYRKPDKFGGTVYGSLLGGGLHLEGASKRFSYLTGVRYKSNQYLLNSLETKGEYKPSFLDFQSSLNYRISDRTSMAFLGHYARNKYRVVPETRETEFGTINEALRLTIYFDGQEVDQFETGMGGISLTHFPTDSLKLKFLASAFRTVESESFDILGQYFLDELERDLGSDEFGESVASRGVGSLLDHARNELSADVYNFEHRGALYGYRSELNWGIKYQHEAFDDELREWSYVDSAGYSLPHPRDQAGQPGPYSQQIELQDVLRTDISLTNERVHGFVNYNRLLGTERRVSVTAGWRAHYAALNGELVTGPRLLFSYKPPWRRNLVFRGAAGYYYQPPFYRELRNLEGGINPDVKAQRSIHFVAGGDYQFLAFGREFKLVSEFYYKKLDNLVPYKVENLRVRYFAANNSSGYATGADFRVNGEFVPGTESWISLSILKTEENLSDDFYYDYYNASGEKIYPGYTADNAATDSLLRFPGNLPRPTDQRVTFSMFFQDYIPRFPSWKMHMTLVFGTGLPFGPPGNDKYQDVFRVPYYRRVDIGFSKTFIDEDNPRQSRLKWANRIRSLWVSLEVFNLLQVNNTISYIWISDITNRSYAVPNFLSARTINLRVNMRF